MAALCHCSVWRYYNYPEISIHSLSEQGANARYIAFYLFKSKENTRHMVRPVQGARICLTENFEHIVTNNTSYFLFCNCRIRQFVHCQICKHLPANNVAKKQLQSLIPETTFCEWTHVRVVQSRDSLVGTQKRLEGQFESLCETTLT